MVIVNIEEPGTDGRPVTLEVAAFERRDYASDAYFEACEREHANGRVVEHPHYDGQKVVVSRWEIESQLRRAK